MNTKWRTPQLQTTTSKPEIKSEITRPTPLCRKGGFIHLIVVSLHEPRCVIIWYLRNFIISEIPN